MTDDARADGTIAQFLQAGMLTPEALDKCTITIATKGASVSVQPNGCGFSLTWTKPEAAAKLERAA